MATCQKRLPFLHNELGLGLWLGLQDLALIKVQTTDRHFGAVWGCGAEYSQATHSQSLLTERVHSPLPEGPLGQRQRAEG